MKILFIVLGICLLALLYSLVFMNRIEEEKGTPVLTMYCKNGCCSIGTPSYPGGDYPCTGCC